MRFWHASVVLAAVAGLTAGCGATGTGPDTFAVHFDDDLGRPVVLALCKSAHSAKCEQPDYRVKIGPGVSHAENIAADVHTEWAIEGDSGALLSLDTPMNMR